MENVKEEIKDLGDQILTSGNFLPYVNSIEEAVGIVVGSTSDFMRQVDRASDNRENERVGPELYAALRRLSANVLYAAACVRNNEDL